MTGTGDAIIDGNATLEFAAASSADTTFTADAAGILKLDDSFDFTGMVSGFDANDQLDLTDMMFSDALSLDYGANSEGTGGTLTVTDGSNTASIEFVGQYDEAGFHAGSDGGSGTLLTYVLTGLDPTGLIP